jgi:DNA-binding transcriptional MerR regulator
MAVVIPNRPVFRAQEVCEIADVQPYVLRSWEAEFPDIGVSKTAGGPRVYRRADVERVLRLKHLLLVDGLTLAGARKRLLQEGAAPSDESVDDADVAAMLDRQTRQSLREIRGGLQWILGVLSGKGQGSESFAFQPQAAAAPARVARKSTVAVKAKPIKKVAKRKK